MKNIVEDLEVFNRNVQPCSEKVEIISDFCMKVKLPKKEEIRIKNSNIYFDELFSPKKQETLKPIFNLLQNKIEKMMEKQIQMPKTILISDFNESKYNTIKYLLIIT